RTKLKSLGPFCPSSGGIFPFHGKYGGTFTMVIILPDVVNFLSRQFPQSLDLALEILESYSFIELHSQIFSIYFKLPKFKWPPAEFPVQFLSSMVLFTHKLTKNEWRIT